MIESGDRVPSVPVKLVDIDGTTDTTSDGVLGQGLVVLFTVPGAFTPTCHVNHLPGFLANAPKLKAAGVTRIVCGAANDHHVVKAWAEGTDALGAVSFIADPHAKLAEALGLDRRTDDLGLRYRRSAMIIRDGVVEAVFVEDKPGVTATGAPAILMALEVAAA
jgi:glutaredoxin/glutathione-dependent peroxiredoxin